MYDLTSHVLIPKLTIIDCQAVVVDQLTGKFHLSFTEIFNDKYNVESARKGLAKSLLETTHPPDIIISLKSDAILTEPLD